MDVTERAFDGNNLIISVRASANSIYVNRITVSYDDNGGITPSEPNVYKKVTSGVDLVAGKKYIVVNEGNGVGMGELNTDRYGVGVTGLTIDGNKVDIVGTDVMEMTLGGVADAWTFQMSDNNYLSNSSSSNNVFFSSSSVQSSSTDITKWTITPGGNTSIQSNYVTSQYIRYNASGNFGTYASNAQSPVALYVQYEGTVENPVFSLASGTYSGSQSVTLSTATSGASIYYTTDGSTPSATNGTLYTGAITVDETTTIKAIAVAPAKDDSEVVTATYTITSGGTPSLSTIYHKVTNTDELIPGLNYILVYENSSTAVGMGALNSGKGTGIEGLSLANNKVDIQGKDVIEFTLGGTAGAYTLEFSQGNYLAYNSSANMTSSTTLDNKAKWTATSYGTGYYFKNNGDESRGVIYRISSNVFGAYAISNLSNADYDAAYLYVQESSDAPMMSVTSDNPMTISDPGTALAGNAVKTGTITVAAQNLTADISVSKVYNPNNDNYWTVTPTSISKDATFPQNVTAEYKGKALGSTEKVTFHTATADVDDVTVTVKYQYAGDIYIMGNVNSTGWTPSNGELMTLNSDGTYSKTLTLLNSGNGYAYISFTKALGDSWEAIANDRFGPRSSGDWELNASTLGRDCDLDTLGAYWSIKMPAGEWVVTINPEDNTFKLVPHVPAPVLSLPSGRYFETQTVSITCDNADATISYSTDGGQTWTQYTGPLTISETTTLMA